MDRVRDLMSKQIVGVSKNASLESAVKLMKHSHVTLVPVLDGAALVGIMSIDEAERQLERWGGKKSVGDLRLRILFTEPSESADKAAEIMVANKIPRLPVVEDAVSMKCVGMISSTEVAGSHKKRIF